MKRVVLVFSVVILALLAGMAPNARRGSAQDGVVTEAGDGATQMGFPFPIGETWVFFGPNPPGVAGTGDARAALSFGKTLDGTVNTGGQAGAQVVAMRGGTVSIPCAGMVVIDHGGGLQSVYYPLANVSVTAGATVTRFQAIGKTTNAGTCNGDLETYGNFVDVWLRQGGTDLSWIGKDIGGYTLNAGAPPDWRSNEGCLSRGPVGRCLIFDAVFPEHSNYVTNDGDVGTSTSPFTEIKIDGRSVDSLYAVMGVTFTYSLRGFPANTNATVEWRRPNGTTVPLGTVRTNVAGAAEGRAQPPETPFGGQNALVVRAGLITRMLQANVQSEVKVIPAEAGRGDPISIRLRGFSPSVTLPGTIQFQSQNPVDLLGPITTDANGSALVSFTVPTGAGLGQARVKITDSAQLTPTVEGYMDVVGLPSLTFFPTTAKVGETATARIRKFPANTTVAVKQFDLILGTGQTNANGSLDISFTVPDTTSDLFAATAGAITKFNYLLVEPTFSASPSSAPPGGEVTFTILGVDKDVNWTIEWNDGDVWIPIGAFMPNPAGQFSVMLPTDLPKGGPVEFRLGYAFFTYAFTSVTITDPGTGHPPVANAGPDQTVIDTTGSGAAVSLNGGGSTDPEGNNTISSYIWRKSGVQIATGKTPPPVNLAVGTHTITLSATDATGLSDTDEVVIIVRRAPVADAGPDQLENDDDNSGSELVYLDVNNSHDPDGQIASYEWKEGATILSTAVVPGGLTFTAGVHTITLKVTDNDGISATDTVVITINRLPVANAGPDQVVTDVDKNGSQAVTLNGSGSTDPDGTIASYSWKEGSTVLGTTVSPAVTLTKGRHFISVTVTDNRGATANDQVEIEVVDPPIANAGLDRIFDDEAGNGSELVELDGFESFDFAGEISSYVWLKGTTQIATGVNPTVTLPVGVNTITLRVTNDRGDQATDTVVITVVAKRVPNATVGRSAGTVNTWVTYTVTGLQPLVTFEWNLVRPDNSTLLLVTATVDATGAATGRFRVPATPGGKNQKLRVTSDQFSKDFTFEVIPRIKVTPDPVQRGQQVDISLRGYAKKEVVRIRWKRGSSYVEVAKVTTSNTGSANVTITVPLFAADGENSVRGDGTIFRQQTNTVTISGGPTAAELETPTPTTTPTPTPIATEAPTATPTVEATPEVSPTPVETPTPEVTPEPTVPAEVTPEPTPEPTIEPTVPPADPTAEPSPTPEAVLPPEETPAA